jgi:hypothetical protein
MTLCAVVFALAVCNLLAQSPPPTSQPSKQGVAMPKFAFIFRQTNVNSSLTAEQQKRRTEEVRNWAIHLRDEGHTLEPHLLSGNRYVVAPDGKSESSAQAASGDPIVAILIIDAPSFEEARKIAATHPGLHYGVSIEVHEAASPAVPPVQAARQVGEDK